MKGSGPPDDWTRIDEGDDGVGWMAYPDEQMQRASHALATDDGVWLVDPVDVDGLDEMLAEYGEVAGIVLLLDRHKRDAADLAERHDVPVTVPSWFTGVAEELDAPVERASDGLPGTDYDLKNLVDNRIWQEAALFDGETLVVAESVGSVDYFIANDDRLGVHPFLRARPPKRVLSNLYPDRLRVGHGRGVDEGAPEALHTALRNARRTMPRLYAQIGIGMIRG